MILGAGLLLVIALIVILLQQQGMATLSRSKAQRLVEQMPDFLSQAAEDAAGRWIVEATADTPALKQVFTRMGIYAIDGLSLHDALPICPADLFAKRRPAQRHAGGACCRCQRHMAR